MDRKPNASEGILQQVLDPLFQAPRNVKRAISIAYDAAAVVFTVYAAYALRVGNWGLDFAADQIISVLVTSLATVLIFIRVGLYRAVLRYMMFPLMFEYVSVKVKTIKALDKILLGFAQIG